MNQTPHNPHFVEDAPDVLTTLHPTGRIVLAKIYKNEIVMFMYANRTQAERKASQLNRVANNCQWECYKGLGRPFYIALKPYAKLFGPIPGQVHP